MAKVGYRFDFLPGHFFSGFFFAFFNRNDFNRHYATRLEIHDSTYRPNGSFSELFKLMVYYRIMHFLFGYTW